MPTERLHRNLSDDCDELKKPQEAPEGSRRSQGKGPRGLQETPGGPRGPKEAHGKPQGGPWETLGVAEGQNPRSGCTI